MSTVMSFGSANAVTASSSNSHPHFFQLVFGKGFSAKFTDTKAAEEFKSMLSLMLDMSELNGNENFFYLDADLTAASEKAEHI